MRIRTVEPILLRGNEVYRTPGADQEAIDNGDWQLLIRVTTDEGLEGWSDVETNSMVAVAVVSGKSMGMAGFHTLSDLLVGEDPLDIERLWDKMYIGTNYYGRRGVAIQAISAVDNCLWSIRAQASNLPLCQALGGRRRDKVLAYASTLFRGTPEGMTKAAEHYVKLGFHAVKFGWGIFGQDEGRDRELVAAARDALGPKRHLLIDPGWYGAGWDDPYRLRSRRDHLRLVEWLAEYNVGWVEDFIHPDRYEEYAEVRKASRVPIAAGEQVATPWDFRRFIGMGCVDVIQPDMTRCGGLTVARQVARMADEANIDLVPHCWLTDLLTAYSLHLIATLPRAKFVEFNVSQSELTRGVCGGKLKLNADGTVNIPTEPGLGVSVDMDFINRHRVDPRSL